MLTTSSQGSPHAFARASESMHFSPQAKIHKGRLWLRTQCDGKELACCKFGEVINTNLHDLKSS